MSLLFERFYSQFDSFSADELRNLYIGQSYDLFWTHNVACPTIEQYIRMIDNSTEFALYSLHREKADTYLETGGLFRLLSKLMMTMSTNFP